MPLKAGLAELVSRALGEDLTRSLAESGLELGDHSHALSTVLVAASRHFGAPPEKRERKTFVQRRFISRLDWHACPLASIGKSPQPTAAKY